jgi:uncharacterized protein (TIGR03437 family)
VVIKAVAWCALLFGPVSSAQLIVDTVAGGMVPSGVSAQSVNAGTFGSFTKDPGGNIAFVSQYAIQQIKTSGVIETIAGTGQSGFSGDGSPASLARLSSPYDPRYDKSGTLFFADGFRIRRVDLNGTITTVAGTGIQGSLGGDGPAVSAQIDSIFGMEFDGAGNLYFAEPNQIRRLTPDGHLLVVANIGGGAMTMDASGNFYLFLGQGGEDLYRVAPDGSSKLVGGYSLNGARVFERVQTTAATIDSAGNIYVLQEDFPPPENSWNVWRITTPGLEFSEYLIHGLDSTDDFAMGQINAIAPGDNGALYFADANRIQLFTPPSTTVQTLAGRDFSSAPDGTPARSATLFYPEEIAVSRTGDLYIAEGCDIRKVGSDGLLGTVGFVTQCFANAPMAVDSTGRIFMLIADPGSSPPVDGVASMLPNGTVSILPGTVNLGLVGSYGSLAVDSSNRLYILSTSGVGGLYRWTDAGGLETLGWDQKLGNDSAPAAYMSIDSSDNLYLENNSGQIFRFSPDGTNSLIATFPTPPGESGPLAVDPTGHIWTAVPVPYLPFPEIATLEGLGILGTSTVTEIIACCGYSGDGGPAMSARMNTFTSIAASVTGEIYTLGGIVRKVSGSIPTTRPAISQGGIVNAVSYQGGAIAPGELVSVFGTNFGQSAVSSFILDNNVVPGSLGNVAVLFDGQRGAITAAAPNQINVFAPYEIAGSQGATVVVVVDGAASDPMTVPVAKTAFGLSTADASGSGQGAILNQDGSLNGGSNPAAPGAIVTLFGTGEGVTTPALPDGALVISTPFSEPLASVTVTIGGQPAEVFYAGAAPFLPTGVLQINARIAAGVPAGPALVTVTAGGVVSTQRVTVAVQ